MKSKNNVKRELVRDFVQVLLAAKKCHPEPSLVCVELADEDADASAVLRNGHSIPLPAGVVVLCATVAPTKDKTIIRAWGEALRQVCHPELTDAAINSLLRLAFDRRTLVEAHENKIPLLIYPSGVIWAPAGTFCAYYRDAAWNVRATGLRVQRRLTLGEIIKVIASYNREGRHPAGLE